MTGTFYFAGALLNVSGSGTSTLLGSQYISYDVNLGGKEHQTVHFPVYVMTNVALMQEPRMRETPPSWNGQLAIFGGFAPLIATWLIAQTGDPLSPSFYLVVTAAMSAAALAAIQMRSARDVRAKLAASSA